MKTETNGHVKKPKNSYQRHLMRAMNAGNYFLFRRDYVTSKLLTKVQALFLQDLINRASMKKARLGEDGFFLCTVSYLEKSLAWDRDTQKRLLRELKKLEFVKTEKRRMPPRRYVRVDLEKVETALDDKLAHALSGVNTPRRPIGGKYPPTQGGKPPRNNITTNVVIEKGKEYRPSAERNGRGTVHPFSPEEGRNGFVQAPPQSPGNKLAMKLKEGLIAARELRRSCLPNHLRSWTACFNSLINDLTDRDKITREIAFKQISELIEDHLANIKDQHQPRCRSADSFRRRFEDLEDARRRRQGIRRVKRIVQRTVEERLPNGRVRTSSTPEEVWEEVHVNGRGR